MKAKQASKLAISYIRNSNHIQEWANYTAKTFGKEFTRPEDVKNSLIKYYVSERFTNWWNSCSTKIKEKHIKKWSGK